MVTDFIDANETYAERQARVNAQAEERRKQEYYLQNPIKGLNQPIDGLCGEGTATLERVRELTDKLLPLSKQAKTLAERALTLVRDNPDPDALTVAQCRELDIALSKALSDLAATTRKIDTLGFPQFGGQAYEAFSYQLSRTPEHFGQQPDYRGRVARAEAEAEAAKQAAAEKEARKQAFSKYEKDYAAWAERARNGDRVGPPPTPPV